jgi:hypothetical protein
MNSYLSIIVTGDSFQYNNLPGRENMFMWPLINNTVKQLNELAKRLSVDRRLRKAELVAELENSITTMPIETVLTKYPVLQGIDIMRLATQNDCRRALNSMRDLSNDRDENICIGVIADKIRDRFKLLGQC